MSGIVSWPPKFYDLSNDEGHIPGTGYRGIPDYKINEAWDDLASRLPKPLVRGIRRNRKGLGQLISIWDELSEIEIPADSRASADESEVRARALSHPDVKRFQELFRDAQVRAVPKVTKFRSRWNFVLSLCLKPSESEDIIVHLEDVFARDVERYGESRARLLYRKNVLVSLWPIVKWVLHTAAVMGVLKHLTRLVLHI